MLQMGRTYGGELVDMTFYSARLRVEEIGDHSEQTLATHLSRQPQSGAINIRNVVRHLRLLCASKALIQDFRFWSFAHFEISSSTIFAAL